MFWLDLLFFFIRDGAEGRVGLIAALQAMGSFQAHRCASVVFSL